MFGGAELEQFIEQASWVAVNDYEWGMLQQKTGLTMARGGRPGRGPDRDPRARQARSSTPRDASGRFPAPGRGRWSTRPVAGMPTALV